MTYSKSFMPGSTNKPLLRVVIPPRDGMTTDWTPVFQLWVNDDDAEPAYDFSDTVTITETAAIDLDPAITAEFPDIDPLWDVVSRPASADTESIRSLYNFGLAITKGDDPALPPPAYDKFPMLAGKITFDPDYARGT